MNTLRLDTAELRLDFNAALKRASAIAQQHNQRLGERCLLA